MKNICFLIVLGTIMVCPLHAQWQSTLVSISENGAITYNQDKDGFVIPDFSNAGYKNGQPVPEITLPDRTVIVSPLPGQDNTANIQAAIDQVGQYDLDRNGFRGIVFLNPGKYLVDSTINMPYDGVIIRGSGRESDTLTSTVLHCENAIERAINLIYLGSPDANRWGNGDGPNKTNLTTSKVMPGDYDFEVEDASAYAVGDLICLKYPTTESWLAAVHYGGNTGSYKSYWSSDNVDMSYHRYITAIDGNKITVDAPVFYCLDSQYATPYIYQIPDEGNNRKILHNVGIESLRIEFKRTSGATSTAVVEQNCIFMCSLENSWAKNLYLTGFIHAGIKTASVTRSTIEDCQSMLPSGYRTGANHYNFDSYLRTQLVLYKNCQASKGRHHYVSNGCASVSGIVVLNMASTDDGQDGIAEGHRLWSQGILFDGWKERTATGLNVYNRYKLGMYLRKNEGSGHGYGGTNCVFWNCDVQLGGIYLDKVPTGQNYAIGCVAKDIKKRDSDSYGTGYIEGQNISGLYPASLYEAQLSYRLNGTVNTGLKKLQNDDAGFKVINQKNQIVISSVLAGTISIYSISGQKLRSVLIEANTTKTIEKHGACGQNFIVTFDNNKVQYRKLIVSI